MSSLSLPAGVFRFLTIARITVECDSAMSIGAGELDPNYDVLLMRDAGGLPTIPGTALGGVLKRRYRDVYPDYNDGLFGQSRPSEGEGDSFSYDASRLFISWGRAHDENNTPAKQNILPEEIRADEILNWLAQTQPIFRDHVALNERGIADNKFSRGAVPKGTRFTFEIMIESDEADNKEFQNLMTLIDGGISVGGAVNRGYGRLKHIKTSHRLLDLTQKSDRNWLSRYSPDLGTPLPTKGDENPPLKKNTTQFSKLYMIDLTPEGFFSFGGGDEALRPEKVSLDADYEKEVDSFLKTERIIEWSENGGKISKSKLLFPGASIKGALRHRALFHARRFSEDTANVDNGKTAIDDLFGYVNCNGETMAGRVQVSDVYCDFDAKKHIGRMMHNAIDRFTQGTIDGALYSEELVYGLPFKIQLRVKLPRGKTDPDFAGVQVRSLEQAIRDLIERRLPLGGGASSGHGFFRGKCPQLVDGGTS